MGPETWQRIKPLFAEAQALPPEHREGFLDTHCGDDGSLRRELEALLEGDLQAPGDFLDLAPKEASPTARRIGAYEILRRLDEGGMGEVYVARRAGEDFHKRVALKVLKPGMASDDLVRRFRTERQILGALHHPAIASLLDGGTTEDGLPYFVMEYVEGQPIDRYCDARRLTTSQRLELFCTVCDAVHLAHQNLVVHRDLKPGNILVTADGTPKLLDFGIAKLLNPELAATAPAVTLAGRPMTPDYASPEQIRGEPVTTASDIYSLGVLLHELLSGHLPFHVSGRPPSEMEQMICETEPERMSTAVLSREEVRGPDGTTRTITPESVSKTREGEPARLRRRLTGDLDNIVLMALRKEPQRRYVSAEQLAADIRRHLAGRPVLASGDSLSYRTQKFLRRHRLKAAAAAAVFVAAVGFGAVMTVQHAQLVRTLDREERVRQFLIDLFEVADPFTEEGETISAREILDRGAEQLTKELDDEPGTKAALLDVVGNIYRRLGLFDRAGPLLEASLETRREALGQRHADVAASLNNLGNLKMDQGDLAAAREFFEEALSIRRKSLGNESIEVAETLNDLGKTLHYAGDLKAAEPNYRKSLVIRRRLLGRDHLAVSETLNNLAVVLWMRGDYAASEPLHREALAIRRRLLGDEHVVVSESLNNLAVLLRDEGEYEEARILQERALEVRRARLGDAHPRVATAFKNLARVIQDQGDLAAPEPLYRQALAIYRQTLGDEHPRVANVTGNLASLRREQGRLEEAEALYREAVAMFRQTVGDRHPELGWSLTALAQLLEAQALCEEAEPLAGEALGILEQSLSRDHWQTAVAASVLAGCLVGQGRLALAEVLLLHSHGVLEAAPSQQAKKYLRSTRHHLAELYEASGEQTKAASYRSSLPPLDR